MDLFGEPKDKGASKPQPLARRMRPRNLDEFVGQEHFLGPGKLLRRLLGANRLTSLIFYGPPGTGKTALAHIIADETKAHVDRINATTSNVAEIRAIGREAHARLASTGRRTLLFIDEIHRFNRAQQDVLLGDVEDGVILLIGATTQNPFFAIVSPLVSRSSIFEFKALAPEEIKTLLRRAICDKERGFGAMNVEVAQDALDYIATLCDGDARRALNAIEVAVLSTAAGEDGKIRVNRELAAESMQKKAFAYDVTGDEHYDSASAFIKSMRGSDPDAALYWLARMLESGEDVRFIARRIVICSSEDVGNADPQALVVAAAALQACEFVGMPEAQIILAQAVIYVACSPKSNASYMALSGAVEDVKSGRTLEVPAALKDASYKGAKRLGRGEGYKYSHQYEGGWVEQEYLPAPRIYYLPTDRGYEAEIKERLEAWRKRKSGGSSAKE